jgi:hypothetical protein
MLTSLSKYPSIRDSLFVCLTTAVFIILATGLSQAASMDFIEANQPPVIFVPIGIDISVMIPIASEKLPVEPDAIQSFETLEGIDADGDGVRDDIERWIGFRFPTNPSA